MCSIWELEPSILHDTCICLQHFGAGTFHFVCYFATLYSLNFLFRMLFAAFGSWNLPFCKPCAFCMLFAAFYSWNLPFRMLFAAFGSWKLPFRKPFAFCMLFATLYSLNFPFRMLFAAFGSCNLPFCKLCAAFGSWNLPFCMMLAFVCNILELESSMWHAIYKLLLVVDGCLLYSCGFLFVLLVLLQL